jgi:serine/threonine-protein kinase
MPNVRTTQFFEGLRASRLLDDDRLDELQSRPEANWGDLVGLAQYAQDRGWLTAYQARELEEGRGGQLAVGGYRIVDKLDDGPAGVTYKAIHPALQQPVWLRLLRADWLAPADTAADYISRTQAATLVLSPHVATVLDVGTQGGVPYVVQEYVDGCDLFRLVNEMGALSVGVACEYVRQAALALKAAHEKGVAHGDVSPFTLLIFPVEHFGWSNGDATVQPKEGASIKLVDLGLTPKRPAIGDLQFGQSDKLGRVDFLPPERLTSGDRTAAGDLYGLGATLYFLLTTKPPHSGSSPVEIMLNLQQAEPTPLEKLKPDVPAPIATLVQNLLSRDAAMRPSAARVIDTLLPYCDKTAMPAAAPQPVPLLASETFTQPAPAAIPIAKDLDRPAPTNEPFAEAIPSPSSDAIPAAIDQPLVEPMSERSLPHVEPMDGGSSGEHLATFGHSSMGADKPRAPRIKAPMSARNKTMLIAGLCLHLIATCMCLSFFGIIPNPFAAKPKEEPPPKVQKKDKDKKKGDTHQP